MFVVANVAFQPWDLSEDVMIRISASGTEVMGYRYAITGACNGCQLCEFLAVSNFARLPGTDRFHVTKQPESWEELYQCEEAYERCHQQGIRREIVPPRS